MTQNADHFATYRHYKGAVYIKLCEALHTETEEMLVVYMSAETGRTFCRPKSMFEDVVTVGDYTGPRFTPLS